MSKAAQREKARRRMEARARLNEIEPHAMTIQPRHPDFVHVTIFLTGAWRIEWWPGSGKWANDGPKPTHSGGFDDLLEFVKKHKPIAKERLAEMQAANEFDPIDDEDTFQ